MKKQLDVQGSKLKAIDNNIESLRKTLANGPTIEIFGKKDTLIKKKDAKIRKKDVVIKEKDAKISKKDVIIKEKDAELAIENVKVALKDSAISNMNNNLSQII